MTGRAAALYISYDGALEPLGQSQILPYVRGLAASGVPLALLTFEKPGDLRDRERVEMLRRSLLADGIAWTALRYHKRPSTPATAWDVTRGIAAGLWLLAHHRARVVHCRSYVAALIGLCLTRLTGARFIFDMRGFWPEERVEGGVWAPSSALFRLAKRLERAFFSASDEVIVLTERARRTLGREPYRRAIGPTTPITVIPCCADTERFARPNVHENGAAGLPRTIVYAGSVGTWYMLDEMLDFFATAAALDGDLRFLVLNRGERKAIRQAAARRGLDRIDIVAAAPDEVPGHLSRAYAGLYFIKPVFSKTGASPTKLAEYLAAGLPVIVNAGVGDADDLVIARRVGVVVEHFTGDEYAEKWQALERLAAEPGVRRRCRDTADHAFGLALGVARYREVYDRVMAVAPVGTGTLAR